MTLTYLYDGFFSGKLRSKAVEQPLIDKLQANSRTKAREIWLLSPWCTSTSYIHIESKSILVMQSQLTVVSHVKVGMNK